MRSDFTFYSDPGHGWLLVSEEELAQAGLTEADISQCSYRNRRAGLLALEEDADATTFLNAWEARHGKPAIREIEDRIGIRSWEPFGTKRWQDPRTFRSELTEAGEQLVIPGCEMDQAPGAKQGSLF